MKQYDDRKRGHGLSGGAISAAVVIVFCALMILTFIGLWAMVRAEAEPVGLLLLLYIVVFGAIAVGVIVALIQRWNEVRDGEEDEARKY